MRQSVFFVLGISVLLIGLFAISSRAVAQAEQHCTAKTLADDPFYAACQLLIAGYEKEARAEAVRVVTTEPRPIPESLRHVGGSGALSQISLYLSIIIPILFVVWLLVRRYCVVVSDFDDYSAELHVGTTVRARVVQEIEYAESGNRHMWRLTGPGADIPKMVAVPAAVKFIDPIINWLKHKKQITVSGVVHGATESMQNYRF